MNVSSYIENTLLRPDACEKDFINLFEESAEGNFHAVCVPLDRVSLAADYFSSSDVAVCTVVGFPCGYTYPACKIREAQEARQAGADELDMVMALGFFKDGKDGRVVEEMAGIKKAVDLPLKVIIETTLLTPEEIFRASRLCMDGGADFVKTCTGFNGGATLESVGIIKEALKDTLQIKASGGISSYRDVLSFVEAGVSRIGTSKGHKIWQESLAS